MDRGLGGVWLEGGGAAEIHGVGWTGVKLECGRGGEEIHGVMFCFLIFKFFFNCNFFPQTELAPKIFRLTPTAFGQYSLVQFILQKNIFKR
jgi:hypothetical protein